MTTSRLQSVIDLFYPPSCACCRQILFPGETLICVSCRHDLPYYDNKDFIQSQAAQVFEGRVSIDKTGALFAYTKGGKLQKLMQQLKYKGRQEIGALLANWIAHDANFHPLLKPIQAVVPVPLHPKKLRIRGYNQLTRFGQTLSDVLGYEFVPQVLRRVWVGKTQTTKDRFERFNNTETQFELSACDALEEKHILLIDDVITTGATITACVHQLLRVKNAKVSVLSMAFTIP